MGDALRAGVRTGLRVVDQICTGRVADDFSEMEQEQVGAGVCGGDIRFEEFFQEQDEFVFGVVGEGGFDKGIVHGFDLKSDGFPGYSRLFLRLFRTIPTPSELASQVKSRGFKYDCFAYSLLQLEAFL